MSNAGSTMVIRLTLLALVALLLVVPFLASAQTVLDTLSLLNRIVNGVIGFFVVVAIAVFFWGVILYISKGSGMESKEAVNLMVYGIIALFVMVSVWGIIRLLQRTFSVEQNQAIIPAGVQIKVTP